MNFILRLKNKVTLTAIVGAILLFIKQITEAFGVDLSTEIEQVSGLIGAIITFLVGIGVVTDPTTKGVKDSGITKTYSKPRDENIDPVEYQRKGYEPEQWNDDFAEEVEIEEGLRDVEDDEVIVDNFDSDINNSGVMLDTNQQVEGVVENGENTSTDK
ncbi:phage holin [Staphylococcus haemolyticus]|uniref:phage holin n=1 Tax=Staphylococcus haemolyticus TaxID=1283 RepID=UPI001F3BB12F|nr:phage holin [Staphylococcus haemolyticus]MCE4991241.1 phage holin [Staphylococcus haemolyticus]